MNDAGALVIDVARDDDIAHLAAIERAAAALLVGHAPPALLEGAQSETTLREAMVAGRLFVARADGVPVGFALVVLLDDGLPHLEEIDVHPTYGRRGIGAALVEKVCEWAARAGHAEITLTTFRAVAWNMPFYARMGFVALSDDEVRPALRVVVDEETARGLDPRGRVAMKRRRPLTP